MKRNEMRRRLIPIALLALSLASCANAGTNTAAASADAAEGGNSTAVTSTSTTTVSHSEASSTATSVSYTPAEGEVSIVLADNASTTSSNAVTVDNENNLITITSVGTYVLSGSLSNGTILISADETSSEDTVELILDGVTIASNGSHTIVFNNVTLHPGAIYSENSAKLDIKVLAGSSSVIKDTRAASVETGDDSAAIFSNKKLQIKGSGSLNVSSTGFAGLASDSKIEAAKATLSVSASTHALKAHKSIILGGAEDLGSFTLSATGSDATAIRVDTVDAVTTPVYGNAETNDEIAGIEIKDASYVISSKGNCLSSEAYLYMEGGNGTITSSAGKGIRSDLNMFVDGGNFTVKSPTDDCIHSASKSVTLNGGTYTLSTGTSQGEQGIKGEVSVIINGGYFAVTSAYEGIAAPIITANGGTTLVNTSDDGWSAGGTASSYALTIKGGNHYVYAGGDGLDSNGSFTVSGGNTIVSAPSSGGNGPLDSGDNVTIQINGGNLVAYGVTGMTESLGGSQNTVTLASCSSVAKDSYFIFQVASDYYAVKATRASTTVQASFSSWAANAYDIGYTSSLSSTGETLFQEGNFYKLSAQPTYTSLGTKGSFSAASSTHIGTGSSSGPGGGGTTPGGGGPGGRG